MGVAGRTQEIHQTGRLEQRRLAGEAHIVFDVEGVGCIAGARGMVHEAPSIDLKSLLTEVALVSRPPIFHCHDYTSTPAASTSSRSERLAYSYSSKLMSGSSR